MKESKNNLLVEIISNCDSLGFGSEEPACQWHVRLVFKFNFFLFFKQSLIIYEKSFFDHELALSKAKEISKTLDCDIQRGYVDRNDNWCVKYIYED